MSKKSYLLLLSPIILLIILLFSTGNSLLTTSVFGIPFGNILVWIGLISLQLFFYKLNDNYKGSNTKIVKIIKGLAKFSILISVVWFGIAYTLSGNVNFNFSSKSSSYLGSYEASKLFWNIIYVLVISPFALSIIYSIIRFFERKNT